MSECAMPTGGRKWPHRQTAAYSTPWFKPLGQGKVTLCGEDRFGDGGMQHSIVLLRRAQASDEHYGPEVVSKRCLLHPPLTFA